VKLFEPILLGAKSAQRITQTALVVGKTGKDWLLGDRPPKPHLLRQLFENLGSTYIKLGQFIASSPSFFPDEYVTAFQCCLDKTPPVPFPVIEQVITQSLGKPIFKCFKEINPEPLATASIAQVHAATLITGEDVVIKVQKPGVEHTIQTDLNFLYLGARLLERIAPNLSMASISDIVKEIQRSMLSECDFLLEANNVEEFRQFLLKTNTTSVIAPKIYREYSSKEVLTQERLYGVAFTDLEAARQFTPDPQHSLINAMNTWFATVLSGHSFHADVHAGNLMVLEDGRVGFIDFGIVGHIQQKTWSAIMSFIQAISTTDFHGMASAMVEIGVTAQSIEINALAQDIEKLYREFGASGQYPGNQTLNDAVTAADQAVNDLLLQLLNIGKAYGIHFPREFALLLKQMLYFDRYLQLLAPEIDILSDERFSFLENQMTLTH